MKLDQDDKIIGVKICKDDQDILLSTQLENVLDLNQKLRLFKGRSSKGIKGIKLNDNDKVISYHLRQPQQLKAAAKEKRNKLVWKDLYYRYQKWIWKRPL